MRTKTLLTAACLLLAIPSFALQEEDVRLVYVRNNEIFTLSPGSGSQPRQITSDGLEKSLPAWSKDGTRIAFIRYGQDRVHSALGDLVVMSSEGEMMKSVPIRGEEDMAGGMRFVEGLEWLDPGRVAVRGSANPSLTETAIVDLAGGEGETGIFDDGPGTDFSRDGKHFAYASGSPHFSPESEREPALYVDHQRIFPKPGTRVRFVGARRWSEDSRQLAVIVENLPTHRRSTLVWHLDGSLREIPLPAGDFNNLYWVDGDLIVASDRESLRVQGNDALESAPAQTRDLLSQAQAERRRWLDLVSEHGGKDADLWCGKCILNSMPRLGSAGGGAE